MEVFFLYGVPSVSQIREGISPDIVWNVDQYSLNLSLWRRSVRVSQRMYI
jgi:hypothetical protein